MGGEVVPFPMQQADPLADVKRVVVMLSRLAAMDNVAEQLDENELGRMATRVVREYQIDEDSRKEWRTSAERAMDMARQKKESKSFPWDGASNVKYPLLTTGALQFAARAYPAIVDGPRIVKATVLGRDQDGAKAAAADRVSQHMSYQLLHEVDGWESDVDTALHQIPIVGCAFKKVYPDSYCPAGYHDDLVSAFDFVVHQRTKSLAKVPRATHVFTLYPHEIDERIRSGKFVEFDHKGGQTDDTQDELAPHTFLEQHRYWDLDGDGLEEPWIITVHKHLQKVVKVTAGFDPDEIQIDKQRGRILRIPRQQMFVKVPFVPDPDGGFYDIGFGKLLESVSDVVDSTLNQMLDAATLQNTGGGFMASGANLGKARVKLKLGEWPTVPGTGDDIRKAMVNIEHKGPSPVLFQLLGLMIEAGKDIAAVKDILTGETPTNQTATSTMAAIEQGLKVFTAIYKRIFRALKEEFKLIFEINKRNPTPKYVALLDEPIEVVGADYMGDIDVLPVADPHMVTDMQRMAKAQFLMEQVAAGNPHINPFEATKRALEAARIERIEDVLVAPAGQDPLKEIQVEGALSEIEETKAKTVKTVSEAIVNLATVGVPINAPLLVGEPVFTQGEEPQIAQPMMPEQPANDTGEMGMDGGGMPADPEQMQQMAMMMGGGQPVQPEAAPVPNGMPM